MNKVFVVQRAVTRIAAIVNPLERRVLQAIVLALLPLAMIAGGILSSLANAHRQEVLQSAQDTMQAVITDVDARLEATVVALETLALDAALTNEDLVAFRARAQDVWRTRPFWATMVLSDVDGRQIINLAVPPGGKRDAAMAAPDALRNVVRTGRPQIGGIVDDTISRRHAITVRVPVVRNGAVVYVLSAVIEAEALLEILALQQALEMGVATLLDSSYRIVARTKGQELWVGKSAPPGFVEMLNTAGKQGGGRTLSLEGMDVYGVYARSAKTGWVAAMAVSTEWVAVRVRRAYITFGGAILSALLLGIAMAFFFAQGLIRPLRQLRAAAAAVARREEPVVPDTSLPEIRQAADVLVNAHHEHQAMLQEETRLRKQAEAESHSKDEFLAMLGHELRNPLAGISSAVTVIDRLYKMAPETRPMFDIIQRQTEVLIRLTNDLLQAGRVVTGKVTLDLAPLDFAAAVRDAINALRAQGLFDHHALIVNVCEVWVDGDCTRLEQVVSNIVGNAVKFTPRGGTIVVDVAIAGKWAQLQVTDSGIGLESELAARVFDPFVQGAQTVDRAMGGLGLGLTIVRRLVESHGGTVDIHSAGRNRGTEVTVMLPAIAGR